MKSPCLIFLLLLGIGFSCFGQLVVDAGGDTLLCNGPGDFLLGGSPTVSGGHAPYEFTWTTSIATPLGSNLTASDFLSDTTVSNPELIEPIEDTAGYWFTVHVVDSLGQEAVDSILIRMSVWAYATATCIHFIEKGDSVRLNLFAQSNFLPLTGIAWSPSDFLQDPSAGDTWAKPESSMTYTTPMFDMSGCAGGVQVCSVDVSEPSSIYDQAAAEIELYPNPSFGQVNLSIPKNQLPAVLEIFRLGDGKLIQTQSVNRSEQLLEKLPAGDFAILLRRPSGQELKRFKLTVVR